MQIPDDTLPKIKKIIITVEVEGDRQPCTVVCTFPEADLKGHILGAIGDTVQSTVYSMLKTAIASACKLGAGRV